MIIHPIKISRLHYIDHSTRSFEITVSNNLISGEYKDIVIWDSSYNKFLKRLNNHSYDILCLIKYQNHFLFSSSRHGEINMWDLTKLEVVRNFIGHTDYVYTLCVVCEDLKRLLLSGCQDNTIRIWNIDNGKCVKIIQTHHTVYSIIYFNNRIYSGDWNGLKEYNLSLTNKKKYSLLQKHEVGNVMSIVLYCSPPELNHQKYIIIGSYGKSSIRKININDFNIYSDIKIFHKGGDQIGIQKMILFRKHLLICGSYSSDDIMIYNLLKHKNVAVLKLVDKSQRNNCCRSMFLLRNNYLITGSYHDKRFIFDLSGIVKNENLNSKIYDDH